MFRIKKKKITSFTKLTIEIQRTFKIRKNRVKISIEQKLMMVRRAIKSHFLKHFCLAAIILGDKFKIECGL